MKKKWEIFAIGAAAGALGIMAVDLVVLGDAFAHMRISKNSNGPYKLILLAFPGTAKTGQTVMAQAIVTQNGKPVVNQTVNFRVGNQTKSTQTNAQGVATMPLTYFAPTTVNLTATWKCPCGQNITDNVTVRWAGKVISGTTSN